MFQNQKSPKEERRVRNKEREKQEITKEGEETYPEATGLSFVGSGMPTFCLFLFTTGFG
jgi:hypothetical protein